MLGKAELYVSVQTFAQGHWPQQIHSTHDEVCTQVWGPELGQC